MECHCFHKEPTVPLNYPITRNNCNNYYDDGLSPDEPNPIQNTERSHIPIEPRNISDLTEMKFNWSFKKRLRLTKNAHQDKC